MTEFVSGALFVYDTDADYLVEKPTDKSLERTVTALAYEQFMSDPDTWLVRFEHIVISGSMEAIKCIRI